jgi:hypothetical protein
MTPRQVRRAAERTANKAARKAANGFVFSPLEPHDEIRDTAPALPTISTSQLAASRANSQLSTGAKTPEGKAKSCLNAVKTGLTAASNSLTNSQIMSPHSNPA